MTTQRSFYVTLVFGLAVAAATPRMAFADCARGVRPANAEEKKIYADGYALFVRVAPPAPAGWEMNDDPKDGVLTEVCNVKETLTEYTFSRRYALKEGMEARRAEAQKKINAIMQDSEAAAKANEAKMADIMKRMQALQAKAQELVAANKFAELEALGKQQQALEQESEKLMNVNAREEAMNAIGAEEIRDTAAQFRLTVNWTGLNTDNFAPVTVGTRKAFRQLIPAQGSSPATADFILVVNPAATGAKNVLLVNGDPARAEALLRAAKLQ